MVKKRVQILTASMVLAIFSVSGFFLQASAAKGIGKGDDFPKISMNMLGKKARFKDEKLKGKVVIYDFWASWCTPCKVELPFLDSLYKKHKKDGLVVVGINVDEEQKSAMTFIKDHPVKFPLVFDKGKKLIDQAQVQTMPTSYIVDRKGKVRYVHKGFHKEAMDTFRKQVATLLKEK